MPTSRIKRQRSFLEIGIIERKLDYKLIPCCAWGEDVQRCSISTWEKALVERLAGKIELILQILDQPKVGNETDLSLAFYAFGY